jgi:hypothetical protein
LEKKDSPETEAFLKSRGYETTRFSSAYVGAVALDPKTRETRGMASGGG